MSKEQQECIDKENKIYTLKVPNTISDKQREAILNEFNGALPKGSSLMILPEGYDFIPADNTKIMQRLDDIEATLDELFGLFDSRTR